jgi:hypothetical protein
MLRAAAAGVRARHRPHREWRAALDQPGDLANFQAVEAVKLIMIVWLAGYLVRHQRGP